MALFKRADLKSRNLTDEQIDFIMTESNRALAENYSLKSDVKLQIEEALKNNTVDVKATEEYKALLSENNKIKTLNTKDFGVVKEPYKELVWEKLNHDDKHNPYSDQLKELAEIMPDLFIKEESTPTGAPQFGTESQGTMPTGEKTTSFADIWGYGKGK